MHNLSEAQREILNRHGLITCTGDKLMPPSRIAMVIESLLDGQSYIEVSHENKDSIEVSMNAKGDYAWKIKKYWGGDIDQISAAGIIDDIDKDLRAKFLTPHRGDNK